MFLTIKPQNEPTMKRNFHLVITKLQVYLCPHRNVVVNSFSTKNKMIQAVVIILFTER